MLILPKHLKPLAPRISQEQATLLAELFNDLLPEYEINTPLRLAYFLAQTAHESGGYARTVENLNYSAKGLLNTWPNRFTPKTARAYHRKPEKIANFVYANRIGNGDVKSSDGWRFRGRGFIQVTGRDNYTEFSKSSGVDCVKNPDWLMTPRGAVTSAAWFWQRNFLNALADLDNLEAVTKKINVGLIGLNERRKLLAIANPIAAQVFG